MDRLDNRKMNRMLFIFDIYVILETYIKQHILIKLLIYFVKQLRMTVFRFTIMEMIFKICIRVE